MNILKLEIEKKRKELEEKKLLVGCHVTNCDHSSMSLFFSVMFVYFCFHKAFLIKEWGIIKAVICYVRFNIFYVLLTVHLGIILKKFKDLLTFFFFFFQFQFISHSMDPG
jgi:hypothetical protein